MGEVQRYAAEQGAIRLRITVEAINDMVNHALSLLIDFAQHPVDCEIRFHSQVQR